MIRMIRDIVAKDEDCRFAVSMGVDSIAAYFWMREKGYRVTPVHFNHKIRKQNDLMEQKFRELCSATGANPVIGFGKNLTSESDCRSARLEFYKESVRYGSKILTAHHLNDCVESYLLNCFRGKPNHDLFPIISEFPEYRIVHPFLISRKRDFVQYAERNNLMRFVVEDETNKVVKGSRRNWIRNTIIPEMKNQKLSLEKYCLNKILKMVESVSV